MDNPPWNNMDLLIWVWGFFCVCVVLLFGKSLVGFLCICHLVLFLIRE